MDIFDVAARAVIIQLEEAGVVFPKAEREKLVEKLAITMRAAHHAPERVKAIVQATTAIFIHFEGLGVDITPPQHRVLWAAALALTINTACETADLRDKLARIADEATTAKPSTESQE